MPCAPLTTQSNRRRWRLPLACAAITLVFAVFIALAAPQHARADAIAHQKAIAARIVQQVDKLDARLSDLNERYRYDQQRLAISEAKLTTAKRELAVTRASLRNERAALTRRLITLYESGGTGVNISQVLVAGSLSDAMSRVTAVKLLSKNDQRLIGNLNKLKTHMKGARQQLARARARNAKISAQTGHARDAVARQEHARAAKLASVNRKIRKLVAQKRAAELAAQRAAAEAARERAARSTTPTISISDGSAGLASASAAFSGPAPSNASGAASSAASIAEEYLGVPYVWGGASPSGFDCSGLVMYAFAQVGISLPHSTYSQWDDGTHVSMSELQRGDLVFFDGLGHVGIYLGGGQFIHAPHTGTVVQISSLSGYWSGAFVGGVRL